MYEQLWHQSLSGIKGIFSDDVVEQLARESQFKLREGRKITAQALLTALTVTTIQSPLISLRELCGVVQRITRGCLATAQALAKRLSGKNTVKLFQKAFERLISVGAEKSHDHLRSSGVLSQFNNVYLEDSTTCNLHHHLSKQFKGFGGSASSAGYKIHAIWHASSSRFKDLLITPSAVPDQSQCRNILEFLEEGDLILRDMGYFSTPCFSEIQERGAYFLSRLNPSVKIFDREGFEIKELGVWLDRSCRDISFADTTVFVGSKERLPVRLVAFRVPDEVRAKRLRKQRRNSGKRGATPSKTAKALAGFTVFITNIPIHLVGPEQLGVLYGYRWQIEIIFKSLKSNLNVDIIKGTSFERVQCYIYARLIGVVATTRVFSPVDIFMKDTLDQEVSYLKFCALFARLGLLRVMYTDPEDSTVEPKNIHLELNGLCKQKRWRRTSYQLLQDEAPMWEKFEENPTSQLNTSEAA